MRRIDVRAVLLDGLEDFVRQVAGEPAPPLAPVVEDVEVLHAPGLPGAHLPHHRRPAEVEVAGPRAIRRRVEVAELPSHPGQLPYFLRIARQISLFVSSLEHASVAPERKQPLDQVLELVGFLLSYSP